MTYWTSSLTNANNLATAQRQRIITVKTLLPILGDQLSLQLASLKAADSKQSVVLMTECLDEATYVPHHQKKLVFVFSAMRHFAELLRKNGWTVDYIKLDTPDNPGSISKSIIQAIERHDCNNVVITEAAEWRLQQALQTTADQVAADVSMVEDDRFICSHQTFRDWAASRKQMRMENFYRDMRRQTNLLMDADQPVGDQWNFDADNRKPASGEIEFSLPLKFKPDTITKACIKLVNNRFDKHIGHTDDFWFGVTTEQAESALKHFIETALPQFGDYQDAMLTDEKFLAHSVLAMYINIGLLNPLQVCQQIEAEYHQGHAPLNAVEGFIRQIIGWREYVRGIYWLKMPDYTELNFFDHQRDLPDFYWTADTDMACLKSSIQQTIDDAYAHHIQRLMITGNFAMLIGVNPKLVHEWYLMVYADAYEWVELPNTLGMSQFADGGLLGSKPYAAGGNYIKKMSDYCGNCKYKVNKKAGPDACPFNYLYWYFLDKHSDKLSANNRLAQPYSTWQRMGEARHEEVRKDAELFLKSIE